MQVLAVVEAMHPKTEQRGGTCRRHNVDTSWIKARRLPPMTHWSRSRSATPLYGESLSHVGWEDRSK
jgi:hypothetical protein